MSISGNKPGSANISGWAATQELQKTIKMMVEATRQGQCPAEALIHANLEEFLPKVDGNECLNPPPKMEFPDPAKAWEDLGKLMAEQVYLTAYDPIPKRDIRGTFLIRKARGCSFDRAMANGEFKENCATYAKRAGEGMLHDRLRSTDIIMRPALALGVEPEEVLLSQAIYFLDRDAMKVFLSLAGEKPVNTEVALPNVICGFPGVGKSTLFRNRGDLKILDSDSSTFDKAEFPQNYIAHIKEKIAEGYIILASTHDVVRNALVESNIPFGIVYPALNCKEEYLQRYRDRGSPQAFIDLMDAKWVDFVNGCASQKGCISYCMPKGEYMPTIEKLPKLLS